MNWQDLIPVIQTVAPKIAGVFGGSAAEQLANMAGNIIGAALGVPATPEAVENALRNDPGAADKLAQAEANHGQALVDAETRLMETVNAAMSREIASEHWFVRNARPFNIWTIGVVTGGYGLCLVAATASAVFLKDSKALELLVGNAGVLGIALAPCGAVAGVSAWSRGKEKLAGVAGVASWSRGKEKLAGMADFGRVIVKAARK